MISAGTEPSDSANPAAVEAAREVGLELGPGPGRRVTAEMTRDASVVTFGCRVDDLPADSDVMEWALTDEGGAPLKEYSAIRDAIAARVHELVHRLDGEAGEPG